MRVPPLVPGYCLSICSADFNEWIRKNTTVASRYSYMATGEYEMFEFDLGNRFNYAEMAALIAPRPFMVERGHPRRCRTPMNGSRMSTPKYAIAMRRWESLIAPRSNSSMAHIPSTA